LSPSPHPAKAEEEVVDKSPDAFRTISEVAEDLDLPQHVLRFWETRFGQIKPLKRGGGRRYYRPDDVALIQGLKVLLYGQGYTIKGVQRILKEQGARHVQAIGRGQITPGPELPEPGDLPAKPVPRPAAPGPGPSTMSAAPPAADIAAVLRQALLEIEGARNDLARALRPTDRDG
jgi:DNA-binding transcriptional MerR regulator